MPDYAVRFPSELTAVLDRLAGRYGVTREEVLRRAVAGMLLMSDADEQGKETRIVPREQVAVGQRIQLK